jgi:DNA adenine methylase
MLLRRMGNKSKIAGNIQQYFPAHQLYIELFFGAGGMFFNKPKAKYNIVNDLDSDVFNLFWVLSNNRAELVDAFKIMPVHQDLWAYWKANKETEPVMKALRFLFLSNFGLYGKPNNLSYQMSNASESLLNDFETAAKFMFGVQFMNFDFREVLPKIHFKHKDNDRGKTFIYADPPYLGTDDNYETSFNERDSFDLFETLQTSGIKWAMSEFDNKFVIDEAKRRGLNVVEIGARCNLKKRSTEILVTNYNVNAKLF